jgi:hypothetical protein
MRVDLGNPLKELRLGQFPLGVVALRATRRAVVQAISFGTVLPVYPVAFAGLVASSACCGQKLRQFPAVMTGSRNQFPKLVQRQGKLKFSLYGVVEVAVEMPPEHCFA